MLWKSGKELPMDTKTLENNLKTLGEHIREVRKQKGLTHLDLSFELPFRITPATLSRWENGHQVPKSENIHDLAKTLEVSYFEEIYWLGLAGYIAPTRMPPKEQIISALELFYRDVAEHPYPTYIMDYRSNYWAVGPATTGLMEDYGKTSSVLRDFTNVVSRVFDSRIGTKQRVVNLEQVRIEQVRRFIARNIHRRHEPFWQDYPECLRGQLNDSDYAIFEQVWMQIDIAGRDVSKVAESVAQAMYGYITVRLSTGEEIKFKLIPEPIHYFFGNLFEIIWYYPASDQDRLKADRHFGEYKNLNPDRLKLWNLRDLDEILELFDK
jgi:transcriptional regulator with XRE-family HTH domain